MHTHEAAGRPTITTHPDTRAAGVLMLTAAVLSIVFVAPLSANVGVSC